MELRTSERKTFGWCPQQWFWSYVEALGPRRESTPLWFGTAYHIALAEWYRPGTVRGAHPAETFAKVLEGERSMIVTDEDGEREYVDGRELGMAMLEHYVATFGLDPHIEMLATEETYAMVFKRAGVDWFRYLLTMDGLFRDLRTGLVWILEHKTAKAIRPGYVNNVPLSLDNQAGSYYAAAPIVLPINNLLKPGEKISGILYNFSRKAIKDERPQNAEGKFLNKPTKSDYETQLMAAGWSGVGKHTVDSLADLAKEMKVKVEGAVSQMQPPPYFHREPVFRTEDEQATQLRRIQDEAWYLEQIRLGNPDFPVLKSPGDHCGWCPFARYCELDESGDPDAVESFKQTMLTTRDPYATYKHRKAA